MNMFDEARALSDMLKMRGMTQSQIARSLGVSQSYVANKIRLARLPDSVKEKILTENLCERQARQLLRLNSEKDMLSLADKIAKRKMTVSESEIAVDILVEKEAPKRLTTLEKNERIRVFESFIDESLKSLSSVGISTDKVTESKNGKTYITIVVRDA